MFFCHTSPTVQAFGYLTTDRVAAGGRKGHVVDVSFDQLRLAAPVHIHLHVHVGQGLREKFSLKTKAERVVRHPGESTVLTHSDAFLLGMTLRTSQP